MVIQKGTCGLCGHKFRENGDSKFERAVKIHIEQAHTDQYVQVQLRYWELRLQLCKMNTHEDYVAIDTYPRQLWLQFLNEYAESSDKRKELMDKRIKRAEEMVKVYGGDK